VSALLVVMGVAVVAGAALQAATGFGFALVCAPLVFAALGPQEAIGTLLVLGAEVSLLTLAAERRRPRPLGRDAAVIVAASLPGALAGVAVLRSLDEVTLQLGVTAGVLVTLAVRLRAARAQRAPRPRPPWSAPVAGLAAGALNTSTNTSGPPVVLHLMGRAEPGRVRDTIAVCFLGLGVVSALALLVTGTSGAIPDAGVLAVLVPLTAVACLAGRRAFAALEGSGGYEPVLVGILLVAVVVGLASTLF
jgi:uncharacterized membrane protein YfcA